MKSRIIAMVAALGLLAALIVVADPGKVVALLLKVDLKWIALGLCLWPVGVVLRTERWRYLLRKVGVNVPFIEAAKIYVAGLAISNITPAKSGDPLRSVLLKKVAGDRVGTTLPALIVERAFDIAAMVVIAGIPLFTVFGVRMQGLMTWFGAAVGVYAAVFAIAVYVLSSEGRTHTAINMIYRGLSWWPRVRKLEHRMSDFAASLHSSFKLYGSWSIMWRTAAFSLCIWTFEGALFWLSFQALGLGQAAQLPVAVIVTVSLSTLIAVLTFLPGGIGSSEVVAVAFLTSLFPLSVADVTAAALLNRFIGFWVYIVVGAGLLATMRYRYSI